jgi:Cu/Ag efflux protein CusF
MRAASIIAIAAFLAAQSSVPVLADEAGVRLAQATTSADPSADAAVARPTIKGEVEKIDDNAGKIQLKHDAISNLGMGAMSMVFKASDPAMLKTIKVGDKVNFQADKVNGQLTVMKIEKSN